MERSELIKELEVLLSGKSLKPLSGIPKKCYKYGITAIFINMLGGRQLIKGQEDNFDWVYKIKKNPKEFNNPGVLEYLKKTVEASLVEIGYNNPYEYETIDKIFKYFRVVVDETKKHGKYLTTVSNLAEIIDIIKLYQSTPLNVQPHHWVNIDLISGLIVTVPEFLTYVDLINNWNMFIDKFNEYNHSITSDVKTPLIERQNKRENRKLNYEVDTLIRTLCISSVTFVESYLYYIFFNLKQVNFEFDTEDAKNFIQNKKVEDDEIINRLILKEFIKNPSIEFKFLLKKYKEINKVRNRLIHTSAFETDSKTSELLPLLTITINQLVDTLETCKRIVEIVEASLPDEIKILGWWERVVHPNFKSFEKGDITSEDSPLFKIKYMDGYNK